jgi:enoyl-CoA hydratase/carnithine racemase
MPYLDRHGDVAVINLGERGHTDTENRFHPDWLTALDALLDEVLAHDGPGALVTTASGKFYSNGLDLDWLMAHSEQWEPYVRQVQALLARVLTFPMVTVAALPGHTFAAGAMLALAQDRRVMRADRGFLCFPEVDIEIPFTPGMNALIVSKLPVGTAHESMTTGRRYGGAEAAAAGLVDDAVDEGRVLEFAVEQAQALAGKRGPTLGAIKSELYSDVVRKLLV